MKQTQNKHNPVEKGRNSAVNNGLKQRILID